MGNNIKTRRKLVKKKILWMLLSFLLVASLVLASCAKAVPGEQEEEKEEEEEVVVPPQSRFEGIEIYFLNANVPGCPFWGILDAGARAAAEDLGVDLKVAYAEVKWDKMVIQFKEAIAAKPDGIVISGHPGVEALKPYIDEAIAKGIIVTTENCDLPAIEEEYRAKGFGYVGQDLYASGYMLGRGCIKTLNLGPGDRAMVWGWWSLPALSLRSQGCEDAFKEAGMTVDRIDVTGEIASDPVLALPMLSGYILENPDVKVLTGDGGVLVTTLRRCLETSLGRRPGEIAVAGYDLNTATVDGIRSGYITVILDQQPYLQGYLSVLQICLTKYAGFGGLHIDTGASLVDIENVEDVARLAELGIR